MRVGTLARRLAYHGPVGGSIPELRDSSGNYLFTLDPAAEPPCCQQYGLGSSYPQKYGVAHPLVSKRGTCGGGRDLTAQEWMDYQANQFEACKYWWCKPGQGQGICLADGFYTISYDPKP